MDDHDSSSSALMIGMIVGGVVALTLIALVVLGGAFFWVLDERAPGPGGPAPVMVAGPIAEEVAIEPAGIKVEDPRRQLIGFWENQGNDGRVATMEFRADGKLLMTDTIPGKEVAKQPPVRWEVRAEKNGHKLTIDTVQGEPNEHVLRFLDNDRINIETLEGQIYHRRRVDAPK